MNLKLKSSAQAGFTLIELIVVIVILGILAATALPKFADLGADARKASIQGAKGAITAASQMIHGKWLTTGGAPGWVIVEGTSVNITNGYPNASDDFAKVSGLSTDDYTITNNGALMTVSPKSAANAAACKVEYNQAAPTSVQGTTVIAPPVITLTATNCS